VDANAGRRDKERPGGYTIIVRDDTGDFMAKNTWADRVARTDLRVGRERAVLVGVRFEKRERDSDEDPLAELAELTASAGAVVVARVIQQRRAFHPASCVGRGKLQEIRAKADAANADVIVFDNDLSPSQIREIEKVAARKVLDRSELILDIFASRARTAEARIQVELAQLEYTAPRLRGMWTHLERIAGTGGGVGSAGPGGAGAAGAGVVGGIGTRGPGERQIEIDRRIVARRVSFLKGKIAEIQKRRVREVQARAEHFTVSLVGYTNAGKSTLMNALTGAGTHVEDRLFATLDTLTRRWPLGGGRHVLLSDTVGFIRDLPHHLVASFRATLEEALHADLLLHVADASNADVTRQVEAVEEVLRTLGAGDRPRLLLLNKVDALNGQAESIVPIVQRRYPQAQLVSARTGRGLEELRRTVEEHLLGEMRRMRLSVPARDGKALNFLERFADVLEQRFEDGRVLLDVRIAPRAVDHLHAIAADVRHEA
jgi:GTP-binding protein HflX